MMTFAHRSATYLVYADRPFYYCDKKMLSFIIFMLQLGLEPVSN